MNNSTKMNLTYQLYAKEILISMVVFEIRIYGSALVTAKSFKITNWQLTCLLSLTPKCFHFIYIYDQYNLFRAKLLLKTQLIILLVILVGYTCENFRYRVDCNKFLAHLYFRSLHQVLFDSIYLWLNGRENYFATLSILDGLGHGRSCGEKKRFSPYYFRFTVLIMHYPNNVNHINHCTILLKFKIKYLFAIQIKLTFVIIECLELHKIN